MPEPTRRSLPPAVETRRSTPLGEATEVDEAAKTVSFKEITHSTLLLLPDECHFRKYTLQIDTVADAIKVDKMEPDKGRILRQVTAKISGYVEQ